MRPLADGLSRAHGLRDSRKRRGGVLGTMISRSTRAEIASDVRRYALSFERGVVVAEIDVADEKAGMRCPQRSERGQRRLDLVGRQRDA